MDSTPSCKAAQLVTYPHTTTAATIVALFFFFTGPFAGTIRAETPSGATDSRLQNEGRGGVDSSQTPKPTPQLPFAPRRTPPVCLCRGLCRLR